MANDPAPNPAHIGEAINAVRAAIDVVQHGAAMRVIVSDSAGEALLPAARALGRAAGVRIVPWWRPGRDGCDIVIEAIGLR